MQAAYGPGEWQRIDVADHVSALQIAFLGVLYPCVILCYFGEPSSTPSHLFHRTWPRLTVLHTALPPLLALIFIFYINYIISYYNFYYSILVLLLYSTASFACSYFIVFSFLRFTEGKRSCTLTPLLPTKNVYPSKTGVLGGETGDVF